MRLDELFPFPTERTEYSDAFYGALGRAVAFCTSFEANCRSLAGLMGLKASAGLPQGTIDKFMVEFKKRRLVQHLDSLATRFGLPASARETLRQGREARNFIAHEFALGGQATMDAGDNRSSLLKALAGKVLDVARADLLISIVGQLAEHDEIPSADMTSEYPSSIVSWVVCDID
jgi:hypothetical protein